MSHIWVESAGIGGQFQLADSPAISGSDRGFSYGDGLFETVRVSRDVPLFLARHLARLISSLAQIGFPPLPWDEVALAERCRNAIVKNDVAEGVLKIVATRGVGPRGFEPPAGARPTLIVEVTALAPDRHTRRSSPLPAETTPPGEGERRLASSAILAPWRVDPASPLCYVKHLSALDKVLARDLAWRAGATEALFRNLSGLFTEGAASNLFLVVENQILTPAVACGLLPGIARGLLLETRGELSVPVAEAEIPSADLARASEAFLTNAVMGVRPLVRVDGKPIGKGQPGPITAAVAKHYRRLSEIEAQSSVRP